MAELYLRDQPLGSVAAVLFDKDGTLSHSEPMLSILAQARIEAALHLHAAVDHNDHLPLSQLETLLRRAYGVSGTGLDPAGTIAVAARDHNLISTATVLAQAGHGWPEALAISEEVFRRTDQHHGHGSVRKPHPTDGLIVLLEALANAGVLCAVISNDHVEGIEAFLADHQLSRYFSAIWSADHRPRKPEPGAVHSLCDLLGVVASDCALIGDANTDLRMAAAAGVGVVLGYGGGWSQPVPLAAEFRWIQHWAELGVNGPGAETIA